MPDTLDDVNGNAAPRDVPRPARQIVISFHPDGTPAVSVAGGVTPTNLHAAAFWLQRVATLQLDQQLVAQLEKQGPRLVVPR